MISLTSTIPVYPGRKKSSVLFFALSLWAQVAAAIVPAEESSERMPLSPHSLLLDITIVKDEIIAVGERGHILKSKDGGSSWRQIIAPTQATLTNVTFVDELHGWASGHFGIILSTKDGGETWNRVSEPDSEISYFDAHFSDESNGVFVGSYGMYSKTNDGGLSLESEFINDLEPHFYSIKASDDGTFYLAGEMGQIMRSSDKGKSWKELLFPYEGSLFDVVCLGKDTVLAFGLRGHIYRSENKGDSWTEIENESPEMLTTGITLSSGNILLATIADKVLISDDDGRSFHPVDLPGIDGTVAMIESSSGESVYFCGRHGFLSFERKLLESSISQATTAQ